MMAVKDNETVVNRACALVTRQVEPVGRWYEAFIRQRNHNLSVSHGEIEEEEEDTTEEVVIEDDLVFLRSLDPKEWKDQDHYAVLGLKKIRYKASDDDIKKAYRQKVLRHHPDKRRAAGEAIKDDDDYYTNITKAYEVLGTKLKRISYDSVDPKFDEDVPSANEKNKTNFYEVFGPVLKSNARWSIRKPVPSLGDEDTAREKVESFYNFWYDFQSWREYSYLDEEEKEKGQDREERRWIEKQNKSVRIKRKKEEMTRIRQLVDNAYNSDPRIQKFRDGDREEREGKKKARQDAVRRKKEEEERMRREAEESIQRQKEQERVAERLKITTAEREEKEEKKSISKQKETLRNLGKKHEYFATQDNDKVQNMIDLDKLCDLLSLTELKELTGSLQGKDKSSSIPIFVEAVQKMNAYLEAEKLEILTAAGGGKKSGGGGEGKKGKNWTDDDLQILIKAVNVYPAGTNKRWEVIANYINQHTKSSLKRNAKEVIGRAKELQSSDHGASHLKQHANQKAFTNFEKGVKNVNSHEQVDTERFDSAAALQGINNEAWSSEEQQLLEQALKTFPASTEERWDKIAESIPMRSKKDCMKRYKFLAEKVRQKKLAQASVKTK